MRRTNPIHDVIAIAILMLGIAAPSPGQVHAEEPTEMIERTLAGVIAALGSDFETEELRRNQLEEVVAESFDWPKLSALVLGKNRRKLDADQQREFAAEFQKLLGNTYYSRLSEYSNERIEVVGSDGGKRGIVRVKTRIRGGTADGVAIDYRVHRPADTWLVVDVIIEGVSLVTNYRSQIQEIVSSRGVDSLIARLREKNGGA